MMSPDNPFSPALVSQHWSSWLCSKVHQEVLVDLHLAGISIYINLQQLAPLADHVGVELFVPGAQQAVGHIQPLAIKTDEGGSGGCGVSGDTGSRDGVMKHSSI